MPESIAGIASVLVSGLFIITFVIQAFEIPSPSMEDTLLVGTMFLWTALRPPPKPDISDRWLPIVRCIASISWSSSRLPNAGSMS